MTTEDQPREHVVGLIIVVVFVLAVIGNAIAQSANDNGGGGGFTSLRDRCEQRYDRNRHNVVMSESRYIDNCLQTYEDLRDGDLSD